MQIATATQVSIKPLKYLSFVGKIAGLVSALNVISFVDPKVGVIVFAAASILKDAVNRIGDLLDDGQANQSFKACPPRRELLLGICFLREAPP